MEEFPHYLAETLREIRLVEFTFPDNPVTSGGHGPRRSLIVSDRVTDLREQELGEATRVDVRLGPANLEALDTLIMAGIADDRADAVRWALARFRQQPEYEQLRERVREIDRLRAVHRPLLEADTDRAVTDSIEREIEHEVHERFPGDAVERAVLLHYGDDPEISRGSYGSGSSSEPTGPRITRRSSARSTVITRRRSQNSCSSWSRSSARSGWSSSPLALTPSPARKMVPVTEWNSASGS